MLFHEIRWIQSKLIVAIRAISMNGIMMNWLAHAFLSEPAIESRLGNLLADLVKGRDRLIMSAGFQRGIRQHQAIDSFTDSHPIVHRSRARISNLYRSTTGILVDIFYDHFLALHWQLYSPEPLTMFTSQLYTQIQQHSIVLPIKAKLVVDRIIADDRLGSYRDVEGIEDALARVSFRLTERTGRDFALEKATSELLAHYDEFAADFEEFFPALQDRVKHLILPAMTNPSSI